MSSSVDRTGRNWKIVRLADCVRIRYGLGQPPKAKDGGIPMVRATDIKHGHVVGDRIVQVDPRAVPHTRDAFLVDGDVIVVRSGAYTGDVGLYEGQWDQAIAGYDLVVSPANDRLYGPYLAAYLRSNNVQAYFRSQRDRSAQPHLNADQLARSLYRYPQSRSSTRSSDFSAPSSRQSIRAAAKWPWNTSKDLRYCRSYLPTEQDDAHCEIRRWARYQKTGL